MIRHLLPRNVSPTRRPRHAARAATLKFRPACEAVEARTLLSSMTITVDTADDADSRDASLSLREAIEVSNGDLAVSALTTQEQAQVVSSPGDRNTIQFAVPGSGVQTIRPASPLPEITHPVLVDGYTQTGSRPNTSAGGENAALMIELDGGSSPSVGAGLVLGSANCTVRGLAIHGFAGTEIFIKGPGGDVVEGNFLGSNPTGTAADSHNTNYQIFIQSDGNRIGSNGDGDADPAERNVISGTGGVGVEIYIGTGNWIAGNFIGTDASGTAALSPGQAIGIQCFYGYSPAPGSHANWIGAKGNGSSASGERNVISGNSAWGVQLMGNSDVLAGNYIGPDVTGEGAIGNGVTGNDSGGVYLVGTGNIVGVSGSVTDPAAERNVISANATNGIVVATRDGAVVAGNYLGTDAAGSRPLIPTDVLAQQRAGVSVRDGSHNIQIGGTSPAERNVISGNSVVGVGVNGKYATDIHIWGNNIGTDATGTLPVPNYDGVGFAAAGPLQVGGSTAQANTIAFNTYGVDVDGGSTGISIRPNAIFKNTNQGIVLRAGTNDGQSAPVVSGVVGGTTTTVTGTVTSAVAGTIALDFYANDPDKSGLGVSGQGQYYLGSGTTNADGSFRVSLPAATKPGQWISATATAADGSTSPFALDVQVVQIAPSSLSGLVFADFNDDGQVDFGEQGIPGVAITLAGTDDCGDAVNLRQTTDASGAYVFPNLRPGHYTITETQPAGYTQGINTVGTGGGTVSGDVFDLHLAAGLDAMNYNYGERPTATGPIQKGQTAGIGFWNNKNGQALIKAMNGGVGTQLGDWMAATFPHMFGASSGGNSLAAMNNAAVASFFQSRFVLKDQKLDAQVLATALAVYVTDGTLDSTGVGTSYGFTVGGNGVATATYNVGTNGDAFGVADGTVMTVMDLLLAADAQSVNGVLYGGNATKRTKANNVFGAINQAGGI